MRRLCILFLFVFVLPLLATPRLLACPSCAEAVPAESGAGEEDQLRLSRAYNNSIYMMLAVPYLALGTMGYFVYRHLRVREALMQEQLDSARTLPPADDLSPHSGDRACSLPSPDDVS